ncbi:ABC transporter ATP-binding protein [Kribbella antibiotica]|uniref:ABC transporter ATP-binding protein n=1 Tax=Kribbella antibiotica TaxID=190195 RepID=A0A4V2YNB8_9ACTN|nr:ABC transporter ATP-binding protein [Kribbella antibiotica]TDD53747.1 ABC transporter ATP-binding protein [Kribbella antibiotica]
MVALVAAVPGLVSGRLVALAVDRGFLRAGVAIGLAWLGVWAVAVVVGSFGARRVPVRLGAIVEPLRDDLMTQVVSGTLAQAAAGGRGTDTGTVARLTKQVEAVRDSAAGLLLGVQQVGFGVVAAVAGLFWLAPIAAVIAVAPVVLAFLVLGRLLVGLVGRLQDVLVAEERLASSVSEIAGAVRDVVACGAENGARGEIGDAVEAQAAASRALARATALRSAVATIGGYLPLVALVALGPWLIHSGRLSLGELLGAVTYITTGLQPALRAAVQTFGGSGTLLAVTLHRLSAASQLPLEEEAVHVPSPSKVRPDAALDLRVRGLTFAYGPHAAPVVDRFDLDLHYGDHLAVVGPSGIGKSTLAGLLVGLTQPQRGSIHLGSTPLSAIAPAQLRRTFAFVPQESYVFTGTLRENLIYLHQQATDADLDKAVDAIGLRSVVDRLGGYDGIVGRDLSTGERQQIALARSWLSPAEIVVLDEATCHLHPAAEAQAENAFRHRPGTVVVIAHRMSSALRADRVLLLDGTTPMLGTHQELRTRSRPYGELAGYWDDPEPR